MCSINGIFKFNNSSKIDLNLIRKMNSLSAHRGPDSSNFVVKEKYALGANRLAIVDADNFSANQPFKKNNIYVVFNGEIYNYKSLKKILVDKNFVNFDTDCDTEVILELYKLLGIDFINKLEGMFSICIFDQNTNKIFLIRDRMGEKPLYYYYDNNHLIFASELKSIYFTFKDFFSINLQSLENYFSLNYILTNQSIYNNINKLEPGHFITFNSQGNFSKTNYWQLNNFISTNSNNSFEDLEDTIEETITECSNYDKTIGLFLSGGLDSSYIASVIKNNHITYDSATYKFENKNFDESGDALFLAKYLNINNTQAIDNKKSNTEDLSKIIYHLDEPMSDTSIIPFYQLCKKTKNISKVFISGDGGDEVFLGYDTYIADILNSKLFLLKPILKLFNNFFDNKEQQNLKVSKLMKFQRFSNGLNSNSLIAHFGWRQIFKYGELFKILNYEYHKEIENYNSLNEFNRIFNEAESNDLINNLSYLDMKTWLVDDILLKTDRLSMANGLEIRSPFLNHKIVEKVISIASQKKINLFNKKKLLKKFSKFLLPKQIIYKKKSGFNSPIAESFNNEFLEISKDYFSSNNAKKLFNYKYIFNLLNRHNLKQEDNHLKLFNILVILIYLDQYQIIL